MIEYFDTSFIQATICIAKKLLINKFTYIILCMETFFILLFSNPLS